MREKSLIIHMCVGKQRAMDRTSPIIQLAYQLYTIFYRISFGQSVSTLTYKKFSDSQLYTAFVRLANYVMYNRVVNPNRFMEFLIIQRIKERDWQSTETFDRYMQDLFIKETPDAAIERTFRLMQEWSAETGNNWVDFFRLVNPTRAVLWIANGRISPWVMYTAPSAAELLNKMTDEQMILIERRINPLFWAQRLDENKKDVDYIQQVFNEVGL